MTMTLASKVSLCRKGKTLLVDSDGSVEPCRSRASDGENPYPAGVVTGLCDGRLASKAAMSSA